MPVFDFPIAEHFPDPIFVFNNNVELKKKQGAPIISWVNGAAETWVGRSAHTIIGKSLADISPNFTSLSRNITDYIRKQSSVRGHEFKIELAGGRKFVCRYLVFPYQDGLVLMIKPQHAGWNKNQTHQKEGAVNMLGRMLAHELKNPLAGIRGAAQLLESELQEPDNLELTGLIQKEVDRIGRLVEQIELFGSDKTSKYEKLNIHTILRNAKLLFQSQQETDSNRESIVLTENYDPSLPEVYGDKDGLMQVVVNLIANAVEAIQNNPETGQKPGKIELQTLFRTGVVKRLADGSSRSLPVEVRVIDNGPGISKNIRERVFQPFVTGKANGHGLGLALVSKIISEHGGLIDVKTEPEKTMFSILLPITPISDKKTGNEV